MIDLVLQMGITPSRWVLVPAALAFLLAVLFCLPYRLQHYLRQRPFGRPENEDGYITDDSSLTRAERFAFSLERPFTKRGKYWEIYRETIYQWDARVLGFIALCCGVSLALNAIGM
mgnify:CR=1 FL=1